MSPGLHPHGGGVLRKPVRSWMYVGAAAAVAIAPVVATSGTTQAATRATHAAVRHASMSQHMHIDCSTAAAMCTEVANSDEVFGHYVGHDEPSMAFYSHKPGSGNHMSYNVTLPTEPSATNPNNVNKAFSFELSGADWFGMAMCDTQSFPEQIKTCTPDSDSNILNPASNSLNNSVCQAKAGVEYLNFAFVTKNGKSTGPANPLQSTLSTFTPSPKDLFMNPGDHLKVAFGDTPNGLKVTINDRSTGQSGSMTASKANGFAMVKWAPKATSCQAIPYNFHPMYRTSSTKT